MASSNPAPTDTITSTTPAGAADAMMPITITHLVLIAIAIVLTVLMIVWGQRRWRQRRAGERALEESGSTVEVGAEAPVQDTGGDADAGANDAGLAHVVQPAAEPAVPIEPAAPAPVTPAPPPPVSPAPPPLADTLPATPAQPSAIATDLTKLKGLGPKAAALLAERGIASIAELAALSPEQAAALDAELGPFAGRMGRDRWHEQARLLADNDRAGYEAIFGKLG
ncbi:helix-hairpin-helix domain-containing protein [Sphingomonas sp. Y38-1Y]|uniref:helix-hairpin-helix domain-containing protein n=1 Tax=Sphingomonas sp. Y38-1Y TaxID=3078265 RepID=UPI0028EA20DA|nr:helix-hairpin-helix domain-containing protein [Sphingomonas sp. Y38-1Y]